MKPKYTAFTGEICLAILLFISVNCSKDNDNQNNSSNSNNNNQPPPPPPRDTTLLYYGGEQQDAPTLDPGTYEAAARFTPTKIGNLVNKTIKEIRYYIAQKPDSVSVKLYGPLDDKAPGDLLYSADVTDSTTNSKWNVHTLTQPITLKNEDIWLSIEFKVSSSRKTIGCDPGPAIKDGDWLYSSFDTRWTPYNKRSGTSINWNIRIKVN